MPMNPRKLVPTQEPGVLDFAPGAAAAYSLRNLSLSYAGPVVTVRRSTDDAEADFTASEIDDGTLAAWCSGGDGFVKTWHDQSQYGRDATQATAASQPKIVDAGSLVTEGGKATVDFNAQFLQSLSAWGITGTIDRSIFIVFTPGDLVIGRYAVGIGDNSASAASQNWDITFEHAVRVGGGNEVYGGGIVGVQQVVAHIFTGTNVTDNTCYVNGAVRAAESSTPSTISTVDTVCRIGRYGGSAATSNTLCDGRISELIVYPSDMTALRTRIEGNLAWYY